MAYPDFYLTAAEVISPTKVRLTFNKPVHPADWADPAHYTVAAVTGELPSSHSLDDGLLAYWKFDGNSVEAVRGGTGTDTAMTYATSVINQGAVFNGTSSLIRSDAVPLDGSLWSMSAWIKPGRVSGSNQRIVVWHDTGPSFYMASSTLSLVNYAQTTLASGLPMVVGVWTHAVATFKDRVLRFYRDGVETASLTVPVSTSFIPNSWTQFGSSPNWTSERYQGTLDEVGFWDRCLSAADVASLYAQNLSGKQAGTFAATTINATAVMGVTRPSVPVVAFGASVDLSLNRPLRAATQYSVTVHQGIRDEGEKPLGIEARMPHIDDANTFWRFSFDSLPASSVYGSGGAASFAQHNPLLAPSTGTFIDGYVDFSSGAMMGLSEPTAFAALRTLTRDKSKGLTAELWIRMTGRASNAATVFRTGARNQLQSHLSLAYRASGSTGIYFTLSGGSETYFVNLGVATTYYLPLSYYGTWMHLAITRENIPATDNATCFLFINGVKVATAVKAGMFGTNDYDVFMLGGAGYSPAYGENPTYDSFDDFRISDVVRSDAEIMNSYLRGTHYVPEDAGATALFTTTSKVASADANEPDAIVHAASLSRPPSRFVGIRTEVTSTGGGGGGTDGPSSDNSSGFNSGFN